MMVCQECGNATTSADRFCTSCGALLEWFGEPLAGQEGPPARQPVDERPRPRAVAVMEEQAYTGPYCSTCGARNATGRTFCRSCGERLRIQAAPPPPAARGWWRRLLDRLHGRPASRAGDRPPGFVRHDTVPADAGHGKTRPAGPGAGRIGAIARQPQRARLPRRLALSKLGPLILVLGLVGVGIGPARGWITAHLLGFEHDVANHTERHYVNIVPVGASASSAAPGHGAGLAIDGIAQTYWLTAPGHAHGRLTVMFSGPVNIDAVGLLSGEPGGGYTTQARPETLKISAPGHSPVSLSFDDTANFQSRTVTLHGVTRVTVTVKKTYAGQQGQAVALREIEFFNLR